MKRKILIGLSTTLLIAGLLAAHLLYWYAPRLRPGTPRPGSLPARLLASDEFPVALWVPFPHQNLGHLEKSTAGEEGVLEAAARLAGLPAPRFPGFGPLAMPPASELVFAADESGERFALAAEVYPGLALFAKLAGRLASNPWLLGGELSVDGRRVEIAWQGNVWSVASPGLPRLDAGREVGEEEASLLIAEVRQASPPLPAGRYRLTLGDGLLEVRSETPPPELGPDEDRLRELRAFLVVLAGEREALGEPTQAMAFFSADGGVSSFDHEGSTYELPGMASIYPTGTDRWSLPGEKLLKWTGREIRQAELGEWSVAALDASSFERAGELVAHLAPVVEEERLVWALWLDLDGGLREVRRIAETVGELPLVSPRRRQRWSDAVAVLTPMARHFSHLQVTIFEEPRALSLRLEGRSVEP